MIIHNILRAYYPLLDVQHSFSSAHYGKEHAGSGDLGLQVPQFTLQAGRLIFTGRQFTLHAG
jgi:hypothetical protein